MPHLFAYSSSSPLHGYPVGHWAYSVSKADKFGASTMWYNHPSLPGKTWTSSTPLRGVHHDAPLQTLGQWPQSTTPVMHDHHHHPVKCHSPPCSHSPPPQQVRASPSHSEANCGAATSRPGGMCSACACMWVWNYRDRREPRAP